MSTDVFIREIYKIAYIDFVGLKNKLENLPQSKKNFHHLYIPIMRGMRPPTKDDGDAYFDRSIFDYFSGENEERLYPHVDIFTGLKIYNQIQDKLLGTLKDRKLIEEYEEYLQEKFFEGKNVTLIPRKINDVLTVKIGEEEEKEIYDVGDGLQSIITITYPLFVHAMLYPDNSLIACIEEPELLMHPGLQRTLVNELMCSDLYKNIQFFVTTHSNHFLDLSLDYDDISIFQIKKNISEKPDDDQGGEIKPRFSIENVSSRDKQTLELLGVRNSSVFYQMQQSGWKE